MLDDLVGIAAPSQFIGRLNDQRVRASACAGHTIQGARIVPCGIDQDGDLIELTFAPDPAASSFEDRSRPKNSTFE